MKGQLSGMASSPFPIMRFLSPPLLSDRVSREVKILNLQPRKLSISKHLPAIQSLLRTFWLILSTIQQSILPGQNPKKELVSSEQAFCPSSYSSQTCILQAEFVYMLSALTGQTKCKQTQLAGCKFD